MRVAVLSADPVFGESLACLLANTGGAQVVVCLTSLDRAYEVVLSERPDVLLVTEEFLEAGGRAQLRTLKNKTALRLMLIHVGDPGRLSGLDLFDRVQSRWSGVVALIEALRTVALAPSLSHTPTEPASFGDAENDEAVRRLLRTVAPRERETARLVTQGFGNAQIAETLGISQPTVKLYVSRLLRVFQCSSRTQLALRLMGLTGEESSKTPVRN